MQISKARHLKTLERSRMKIQDSSEDITHGEILFLGPKTSYMEENTQKDKET